MNHVTGMTRSSVAMPPRSFNKNDDDADDGYDFVYDAIYVITRGPWQTPCRAKAGRSQQARHADGWDAATVVAARARSPERHRASGKHGASCQFLHADFCISCIDFCCIGKLVVIFSRLGWGALGERTLQTTLPVHVGCGLVATHDTRIALHKSLGIVLVAGLAAGPSALPAIALAAALFVVMVCTLRAGALTDLTRFQCDIQFSVAP